MIPPISLASVVCLFKLHQIDKNRKDVKVLCKCTIYKPKVHLKYNYTKSTETYRKGTIAVLAVDSAPLIWSVGRLVGWSVGSAPPTQRPSGSELRRIDSEIEIQRSVTSTCLGGHSRCGLGKISAIQEQRCVPDEAQRGFEFGGEKIGAGEWWIENNNFCCAGNSFRYFFFRLGYQQQV